ncbi:MAG: GNAT family N-acetyltransferase [Sinimarinibacterium flocculans]|uniref:GNAT family N-acetyltransferase n=1 Tax=Sinimarinibacterium flocculans TaxID=985250 RepID=UPI003C514818
MDIRPGSVLDPAVDALLGAHRRRMQAYSPPESIHALTPEQLADPSVSLWCAWQKDELLGCGALKALDAAHGEIKSMRTADAYLRRGVAAALLTRLIEEAQARGYARLSLETGSDPAFEPARRLYTRFGFSLCGPFAPYVEDPYSVFMTRAL